MLTQEKIEAVLEDWRSRCWKNNNFRGVNTTKKVLLKTLSDVNCSGIYQKNARKISPVSGRRCDAEKKVAYMAQARAIFDLVVVPKLRENNAGPQEGTLLFELFLHASQGVEMNGSADPEVVSVRKELEERLKKYNVALRI